MKTCPKCGSGRIRATFLPLRDMIRRACGCGHMWDEKPEDRKAEGQRADTVLREPVREGTWQ